MVDELKAVFDPRGGQWLKGKYVPSLLAAIGEVIETHMLAIGFLKHREGMVSAKDPAAIREAVNQGAVPGQCPSCGSLAMVHQEGCALCTVCGYSKCG